jgi:hypothetical protein
MRWKDDHEWRSNKDLKGDGQGSFGCDKLAFTWRLLENYENPLKTICKR